MKRTLNLKRERLADLDAEELGAVVAGQEISIKDLSGDVSCPIRYCLINTNMVCLQYTWAC